MSEGRLIKNKLRIVRQVGRGGMGFVYEAFHEGLRVTRAIKQIVGDLQDNPDIERRFLHEAQMMARLEHPHIVRVFDIDQEPGFGTYLLMEFVRGRDLGDVLRQEGRFPYGETLRIGIAVASALECAHRAGLVHRDIKPANILIEDGTGRPVVTDFGIAKEVESANDENFTRTGSFVGTYRYSSREQIRSEKGVPIDGRADVYSLGVVLYEIYAGKKYLAGMPELKIASCVGYQDDWEPLLDYPEAPPPRFKALIDECLAPDRDERIRSAAELVDRLEECRRLDILGAGSPAEAGASGPADVPLAATSATQETTQTAPSDSGLIELTATTLDRPVARGESTETRSQWVSLLQGLRGAVDDQAGEFEQLLKELIELDLPRDDFRQLDDMSQILHRVEVAESEGKYQDAASNLQGLSDRIQQLNARIEQTLGEAIERTTAELGDAWRGLAAGAGELLDPARTRAFEQVLASIPAALEAGEWTRGREALREARATLEQAGSDTRAAADARIAPALREIASAWQQLAARSEPAARASGVDPATVGRETDDAVSQGAYVSALRLVDRARAAVREAAERFDRDERAALDAARAAARQARSEVDPAEARELAMEALRRAESALGEATRAEEAGRLAEAVQRFAAAETAYREVGVVVAEASTAQIGEAREALRVAMERASSAPDEVVGDARRAARDVLEGAPPRSRADAVETLRAAASALDVAVGGVAAFEAARDAEAAAQEALERASTLGAGRSDLAVGTRHLDDGRGARSRRSYGAAAEAFARAREAFEEAGSSAVARDQSERIADTRAQIGDELRALDVTLAGELCADDIRRALAARDVADRAEQAGDRAAAIEAGGEALGALRAASLALLAGVGERSSALQEEVARLTRSAGELLAAPVRAELERGVQAIERAIVQRDARTAASALDDAWRRVGDVRVALDSDTRALARDLLGEIRTVRDELEAADADASRGIDADGVAAQVDALLGVERFADARAAVVEMLERARALAADVGARRRAAADAARDTARAALRGVDREAAGAVAAAELAEVERRFAAAEEALQGGRLVDAVRLFGEAGEAASALAKEVRGRELALYEAERRALEEVLARARDAAPEIVGKARDAARALVEATVAGDVRRAAQSVLDRRRELEGALAEAEQFAAAREQQRLAREAEQRVTALAPSRKQLKTPSGLARDADAAFSRKRWPQAAEAHARALAAWLELERELAAALARERAAAQAKAEASARAAAEKKAAAEAAEARALAEAAAQQRERAAAAAKEKDEREQAAREAKQREDAAREAKQREQAASAEHEAKEKARQDGERKTAAAAAASAARATDATVAGASDATVAGPSDATVLDVPEATRIEAREATRVEAALPAAKPKSGLPIPALAGGAVALVAAAGVALWLAQRAPEPAPVAKVQEPAKQAAPAKKAEPAKAEPAQPTEPVQAKPVEPVAKPAEEPGQQVASVAPPAPVAPPPLRIAGVTPPADEVSVKEGARQVFSIDVTGGAADKPAKIVWRLDDRVVASDGARFEYAPGYDAGGDQPRKLEAVVGEGPDALTRTWRVAVANVNRKPQLATTPKAGGKLDAKLGETVQLAANVKDEDGDPIRYAWKVDGKPVADDAAELSVAVTGDRTVSVTASDGSAEASATWRIAAIKPVLKLDTTPARLERLRFEKPQEFELSLPPGTSGVEAEWTVDGRKVANGARFTFANDDPAKIRRTPVEIAVAATDAQGAKFNRTWSVVVEPPAPQLESATPPAGGVEVPESGSQTFRLAARSPIGGQDLSYVFQVDGRQAAKGKSPSFTYRPSDDRAHEVTGFVQDNFDQVSSRTEWTLSPRPGARTAVGTGTTGTTVAPAGDVVGKARSWLDDYQSAFNAKDAARLGQLRGLAPAKVAELQKVLDGQEGLRVTFSNVQFERLGDDRVRITYTRSDDFTDARGAPVSRTGVVEQTVGLVEGRVTELETKRR